MWSRAGTVTVAFDIGAADVVGVVGVDDLLVVLFILLGESNYVGFADESHGIVLSRWHVDSLLNCDRVRLTCKRL